MPRALFVTTVSLSVRGGLLPLARHFRQRGWEVDAMARGIAECGDCSPNFDRIWEIDWSRNPLAASHLRSAPKTVQRIARERRYDLVHVHTPVAAFVARYALRHLRRELGCRVIYTAHGFHFHPGGGTLRNGVFSALEKMAAPWTDHLVTINRTDYDAALRLRLVPPSRLHLMPGIGIDTGALNPESISQESVQQLRAEIGITPETPLFTMAAEFIERKRHRDLLAAFARMQNRTAHLALPGPGVLLPEMKELAGKLGIADRVHFLGFRRDVPVLLRASLASVLCSNQEGLPLAAMESLSLGVPVIGTNIRGTSDLLKGGAGLLVEVGDAGAIARALDWAIENGEPVQRMGLLGRRQMSQYDVAAIISLHEKLYSEVLAG